MDSSVERAEPDPFAPESGLEQARPPRRRMLLAGGLVVLLVAAAAVIVPALSIADRKAKLEAELERKITILAESRAEVIATWLAGNTVLTNRIVDSELFRLFATETKAARNDFSALATSETGSEAETAGSLAEQLPFMERVLTDFTLDVGFLAGYLVGLDGATYAASGGAPLLEEAPIDLATRAAELHAPVYGLARDAASGLVTELALPVFEAQRAPDEAEVVGAMIFTLPVGPKLAELLAPRAAAEPGEASRLLQASNGQLFDIQPGASPSLAGVAAGAVALGEDGIGFARRAALGGGPAVYSAGAPVRGSAWWVLQELPVSVAEAALKEFTRSAIGLALLVVVAVCLAFGAFWWRMSGHYDRALAEQFRDLAGRIASQKRLLDSINDTIAEQIGLKDAEGRYRYVNPAFARAVGRPRESVIGLDDAALFGHSAAQRLRLSDEQARDHGRPATVEEKIYVGSSLRHLQISKVPLDSEGGGIVSVTRDVTDLVELQRKKEQAIQQTVSALVLAIEMRDPYLAGHSKRVAGFAAEVAQRCGASAEQVATLSIAANLSQIGKLGVSRDVLTKRDRLSDSEIAEVQGHMDYARAILEDIDFELPVLETICQMHERLDGKGYPKGLTGNHILLTAQILGLCDVFCARVEPRGHRAGIPPAKALEILEQNDERYDPRLVDALRETIDSVAGEKLVAAIGRH